MDGPPFLPIAERFFCAQASPEQLDMLLALGWRHFGSTFFRYNHALHQNRLALVQPLRIPLAAFHPGKSFRRVLSKNRDLEVRAGPLVLDEERRTLFLKHRSRFRENLPPSLEHFLGEDASARPVPCVEIALRRYDGRLLAASWLDLGLESVSSIYGIFDPEESARSLGLCTMLEELRYARDRGYRFYYPGYAYDLPSPYDYKKRFTPSEVYDWHGEWRPAPPWRGAR
jgi:arginine-tRNA-protein transferase